MFCVSVSQITKLFLDFGINNLIKINNRALNEILEYPFLYVKNLKRYFYMFISFFQDKKAKEPRHDHFLRKFEYTKALDQVLKPYVQQKFPEYTYSVLKELKRY